MKKIVSIIIIIFMFTALVGCNYPGNPGNVVNSPVITPFDYGYTPGPYVPNTGGNGTDTNNIVTNNGNNLGINNGPANTYDSTGGGNILEPGNNGAIS